MVVRLVRHHMYGYDPTWSDAAVRRFIAKIGPDELPALFLLREADNVGSGRERDGGGLAEFRARVAAQLEAGVVLSVHDLAIDGDDLMAELGLTPSPGSARSCATCSARAVADPSINTRGRLLAIARSIGAERPDDGRRRDRAPARGRARHLLRSLDRAEQLYRQVADADPRNSIAVVGLARVALDRRDDLGAYLLARRALAIDPENDAARRLAIRLEEVLATRGDPVDDPMPTEPMPVIAPPPPAPTNPARADAAPPPGSVADADTTASAPAAAQRRSLLDRLRRR